MLTIARTIVRRISGSPQATITSALAVILLATAPSLAAPKLISAENDPEIASSFTLDIPSLVLQESALISQTDITFRLDSQEEMAEFVSYQQDAGELLLPTGDGTTFVSTGALTIEIVPGFSSGSYDPAAGTFATVDTYAVYFANEAFGEAYGLESPQIMTDVVSTGTITFDTRRTGTLNMAWIGDDFLDTPFGTVPFSYTCNVNTKFIPVLVTNVAFAELDGAIDATDTDSETRGELLGFLNDVIDAMTSPGDGTLVPVLESLIDFVNQGRGDTIDDHDADALVDAAESMINAAQQDTVFKGLSTADGLSVGSF